MASIAIFAAFFCVFNVLLWIMLFARWRKIFSPDGIIRTTREEMTKMVSDINNNADRNISLIDDRIAELKKIAEEADKKIAAAKEEIAKLNLAKTASLFDDQPLVRDVPVEIGGDDDDDIEPIVNFDRITHELSHREPIIAPQSENNTPRVFPKRVEELYQRGYSIEQIAHELSRSTSEVSFALDMGMYR